MDKLLNVAELAQVLGITPKAVYCRLHEGRQSVPAPLFIPGSTRLRWRQSDVEAWLAVLPTRFQATREVDTRNILMPPNLFGGMSGRRAGHRHAIVEARRPPWLGRAPSGRSTGGCDAGHRRAGVPSARMRLCLSVRREGDMSASDFTQPTLSPRTTLSAEQAMACCACPQGAKVI